MKQNQSLAIDKAKKLNAQGRRHQKKGDSLRAIRIFSRALELDPNSVITYNDRGIEYHNMGMYRNAVDDYTVAISIDPSYLYAYNNRGNSYKQLGDYSEAIRDYDTAILMNPRYAEAYNGRGTVYLDQSQYDQSIQDFSTAISINPNHAKAYRNRGLAYTKKQDHRSAIKDYTKALLISQNYLSAYKDRGDAYFEIKDYTNAIEDYNKVINLDSRNTDSYVQRGSCFRFLGKYKEAVNDLIKATNLDPQNVCCYCNFGIVYAEMGLYKEAIYNVDRAIEVAPQKMCPYNRKAWIKIKMNRYEDALLSINEAISRDNSQPDPYYNLARVNHSLEDYGKAIEYYTQALNTDPNYLSAYNGRGNTYQKFGQYHLAIRDYEKIINKDQSYANAYTNRGLAYASLKRYEKAIADYDQAIKIDPQDYFPWWNRGWSLYNTLGYQSALENWKEALDIHIKPDINLLGCAILNWQIGKAHSYQAKSQTGNWKTYWAKATNSYKTAYGLIEANPIHTVQTLEILQSWIIALDALGGDYQEDAEALKLNAIQRLNAYIEKSGDASYRKVLRTQFYSLYTLNVDRLVNAKPPELWQALTEAEKWKSLALQWLTHPQAEPTDTPLNLQDRVNHLTDATTAILYWHLSPAQITTFLLRPNQDPQVFKTLCDPSYDPATKTQTNFTEWLKQYKELYEAQRKKKGEDDDDESNWQTQLPQLLTDLAKILQIADICKHLQDIQHLILIPHRDLHLLPLHALFNSPRPAGEGLGVRAITYLPQLTPTPNTQNPTPQSPLQSLEPNSGLLFAEMECACLAALYPDAIPPQDQALTLESLNTLTPAHALHFAGHGIHNTTNPNTSALELDNGEQLTLNAILDPNNPITLPPYALVCLAACETGMSSQGDFINEFVGFPGALLANGTCQVLSTLWTVREDATALLIVDFFERWQQGTPAALALQQAQTWLQTANHATLAQWYQDWTARLKATGDSRWQDLRTREKHHRRHSEPEVCPYANPYFWAGFILTGMEP